MVSFNGVSLAAPTATRLRSLPTEIRLMALALAFRCVASFVSFLATITIPNYQNQGFSVFRTPTTFWDWFARYDSGWYHGIASDGYAWVPGGRSNLAFFPLYPTLMRYVGRLFGGQQYDFYIAGVVISWLSFILAIALIYRLARLDLTHEQALRATTYAAVLPGAYFFGVVYTESLFLLALVGTVLALRSRRWLWAAIAGAAMTATRVNGVMFLPALTIIAWRSSTPNRRDRTAAIAAVAAASLGIGLYSFYNYRLSGNPFEWYASITRWGYHPGGNPIGGFLHVAGSLLTRPTVYLNEAMAPYDTLNALSAALGLASVPFVWKRFGFGYAAIVLLGLALPLSSGALEGLGRYTAVLFPIPLLLGSLPGEMRHTWIVAGCTLFFALGLVLFSNVHPLF